MKLVDEKKICTKCSKYLKDLPKKRDINPKEYTKLSQFYSIDRQVGYNDCLKDCEGK